MAVAATARRRGRPGAARRAANAAKRRRGSRQAGAGARKPRARPAAARPARRPGGQLIPIAVGTATAVRHLPDSGLMVRMTRGRAWIGVLGVLLVGIVALNVVTLSLAASAGQIDQNIQALEQENSILRRPRRAALRLGRVAPRRRRARPRRPQRRRGRLRSRRARSDVAIAAQRLAAAGRATRGRAMRLIERRIGLLFAGFLLCFLVIVGRAFWLQGVQGAKLASEAV